MRYTAMNDAGPSRISLTIPAKPDYLIVCRLALNGLADVASIGDEALSDLKLAVTEACANSVSHAYANGDGTITLQIDVLHDRVRIEVADEGAGIGAEERAAAETAGPEALEGGGMGIALIRALVDELDIVPGEGGRGTRVVFAKLL
jgi:serine/threonine-protein kinase RsbW